MIASFGVEKNDVAKWAGFTGAIFSVAQSCTAVAWGRASDKFGRKPIILSGLASTMVCFLIWGMSTSLPMAITVRAIMGGGNGNVGIIRTMVAEMVPERELQPKAFSLMPLVWSIGSVFGPAFGGFFARPAEQYPSLFGNMEYFKRYPFVLPNLMACFVFFISFMTGLMFLKVSPESQGLCKQG
jgi:MFS family permease